MGAGLTGLLRSQTKQAATPTSATRARPGGGRAELFKAAAPSSATEGQGWGQVPSTARAGAGGCWAGCSRQHTEPAQRTSQWGLLGPPTHSPTLGGIQSLSLFPPAHPEPAQMTSQWGLLGSPALTPEPMLQDQATTGPTPCNDTEPSRSHQRQDSWPPRPQEPLGPSLFRGWQGGRGSDTPGRALQQAPTAADGPQASGRIPHLWCKKANNLSEQPRPLEQHPRTFSRSRGHLRQQCREDSRLLCKNAPFK